MSGVDIANQLRTVYEVTIRPNVHGGHYSTGVLIRSTALVNAYCISYTPYSTCLTLVTHINYAEFRKALYKIFLHKAAMSRRKYVSLNHSLLANINQSDMKIEGLANGAYLKRSII
jgi:hypothetical protein